MVQFLVRDIPPRIDSDAETHYGFKVFHDPKEDNYAHSEIRTLKNGVYDRQMKVRSAVVKKQFRQLLGERARVVIMPQV